MQLQAGVVREERGNIISKTTVTEEKSFLQGRES
jgi:hypothetical protein